MIKQSTIEDIARDVIENHRASIWQVRERWLDLIDRYENKLREGSLTAQTESKSPMGGAFALVENTIPRLLARSPIYKYLARESRDADAQELYGEYSEYQWEQADAQEKVKTIARWGLATGFSGYEMGWKEERIIRKKKGKQVLGLKITNPMMLKALGNTGKDIKVDTEDITSNYTITPISPGDLIWNIDAIDRDDLRVVGFKAKKKIKELKAMKYDVSNLMSETIASDDFQERLETMDGLTIDEQNNLAGEENVEVAKLYIMAMNDDGVFENYMVHMGNIKGGTSVTISFSENPFDDQFCPVRFFRPIRRLGKQYGFGMIEPATGILDAAEDSLNISLEALWIATAPPLEYNPQNILNMDDFGYGGRKLMAVRDLGNSVRVTETPDLNSGSVQLMDQILERNKQNTSGITDFQTGAEQDKKGKTLGEVRIKTQESNARVAMVLEAFENEVLEPIGKMALAMNKQFLGDQKKLVFRVLGKKGELLEKNIKFKDIDAVKDLSIYAGGTALVDQQGELNKWLGLLNQANQEVALQQAGVPIDREEIWKNVLVKGMLIKDPETFIPSLKEREEEDVTGSVAQLEDAKSENERPETARVLATDNHEVHIKIHTASLDAGGMTQPYTPEQLQILTTHRDDHVRASGGVVPSYAEGAEQGVAQSVGQQLAPQQDVTGTQNTPTGGTQAG